MREIKFRGKAFSENGIECLPKWVEGNLIVADNGDCFITQWTRTEGVGYYSKTYQVIPETVGEYTGLKDKNGREIYEGDIVSRGDGNFKVIYKQDKHYIGWVATERKEFSYIHIWYDGLEVIGNVYENLELLSHD